MYTNISCFQSRQHYYRTVGLGYTCFNMNLLYGPSYIILKEQFIAETKFYKWFVFVSYAWEYYVLLNHALISI